MTAVESQSGRPQQPPVERPSSKQQSGRPPASPPAQESRPRRADDQDDKPVKLSTELVTIITSVTDLEGNQTNDLALSDFEIYEDNVQQDIAGLYREAQMPLRLVFLFDTSGSIRHRFEFEQRAAARFLETLMRAGDQASIISVSMEPKVEI
jgi:Mg-chelatase subunit ChlD